MKKILIIFGIMILTMVTANAESLFTLGATQNYQGVPRSLFGGVQARQIGDLISIRMTESVSLNDNLTFSSAKSSQTTDSFTSWIKDWLHLSLKSSDGYGGRIRLSCRQRNDREMDSANRFDERRRRTAVRLGKRRI